MLQFNRKTEYALFAVQHMIGKQKRGDEGSEITSTREIAECYHLPYPLLAKIMQSLAKRGMIKSTHGTKGGYILARKAEDISVADVMEIFEGPVAVAECFREEKITCRQWDGCQMREPFYELNMKIFKLLSATKVADLSTTVSPANPSGERARIEESVQ